MTVEIARAEGIRHRSSSRMFWRQAGPLAQSGGADERVRGFLIERRGPLNTVALLERRKRPLCLWAHHAIERATVESLVPLGRVRWLEPTTRQPHPSPPFITCFVLRSKCKRRRCADS